jgi:hypothetical protein
MAACCPRLVGKWRGLNLESGKASLSAQRSWPWYSHFAWIGFYKGSSGNGSWLPRTCLSTAFDELHTWPFNSDAGTASTPSPARTETVSEKPATTTYCTYLVACYQLMNIGRLQHPIMRDSGRPRFDSCTAKRFAFQTQARHAKVHYSARSCAFLQLDASAKSDFTIAIHLGQP